MARLLFLVLLITTAAAAAGEPTVIVLSWDGVRADYLDRAEFPALTRVQRDGARAERLIPVFPAITFPNHVSLATGAPVDRHGIVGNSFRDRTRGRFYFDNDASWIEAEPLWVAAERQGVRAAVFFWVGSETDWHGAGATYRKTPFDSSVGEREKVAQLLEWLDLAAEQRPHLLMSWWHGADAAGHQYGPDSPRITETLREQDAALGALLDGLDARAAWPEVTLLIVSDHGMAAVGERVDLAALLAAAGIEAEVVGGEGVANVWLSQATQRDEALTVLQRTPGLRVFAADAVPEALRYRFPSRVGDLVVITTPPRIFAERTGWRGAYDQALFALGRRRGAHGYEPTLPEMAGIFLAVGRGVPQGTRLPPVQALDIAPTVARLLAIQPPRDAEGHPIPAIGTTAPP